MDSCTKKVKAEHFRENRNRMPECIQSPIENEGREKKRGGGEKPQVKGKQTPCSKSGFR